MQVDQTTWPTMNQKVSVALDTLPQNFSAQDLFL